MINEIGITLEEMLRRLYSPNPLETTVCVADLVEQYGVDFEIIEERFKTLLRLHFIAPASIHGASVDPFDASVPYRITAEGVNYLELRDRYNEERAADKRFEQGKLFINTIAALLGGAIAATLPQIITYLTSD